MVVKEADIGRSGWSGFRITWAVLRAKEELRARPINPMKIVLQNLDTFEYAHSAATWTPHVDAAIGFPTVIRAMDYAVKHKLHRVRVAMKFPDSAHNVEFPPVHATGQAATP
jgi:hypothetical protein